MFLRVVDFIADWLGPVLVLLGVAGWFAGRSGYAVPGAGALPIAGLVFSVLALLAAFEEKKKLNIAVLIAAIVIGALWLAWTYFGSAAPAG